MKNIDSRIQNAEKGLEIHDTGYTHSIQDIRHRVQDTRYKIQGTEYRVQGTTYIVHDSGQETRYQGT